MNKLYSSLISGLKPAFAALLIAAAPTAHAILIDFETGSGYAVGNLYNQPGGSGVSKWKTPAYNSTTAALSVVDGVGINGGQAVRANPHDTVTSSNYTLVITDDALGDIFDANSSKISFSFQLMWEGTGTYLNQGRFFVGGTSENSFSGDVLRVYWATDGSMGFVVGKDGGTDNRVVKNAAGGDFRAQANTFYTITGTIDYASKSYTLSINNVVQKDVNGNATLSFVTPAGSQINPNIQLMSLNNNNVNYKPWIIDNIEMQAIPEPASAALAGWALFAIAGIRFFHAKKGARLVGRH